MCDVEKIAAFSAMLRCHYFFVDRIEIEPVRVRAHVLSCDFYIPGQLFINANTVQLRRPHATAIRPVRMRSADPAPRALTQWACCCWSSRLHAHAAPSLQ